MICKKCGEEVDLKEAARELASIGGKKSRRELTHAQAMKMLRARRKKRKAQKEGQNTGENNNFSA